MSVANSGIGMTSTFLQGSPEEPHAVRRAQILAKYPQIKDLMKPEPRTKYLVVCSVLVQLSIAYWSTNLGTLSYILLSYCIGASLNHSLFLAIHEMSHNLAFVSPFHNKVLSVFANIPIGFPYCATFKSFHMHHHTCQGTSHIDTDIPSELEALLITSRSYCYLDRVLRKLIFVSLQIFAYALRPACVNPSGLKYDSYVATNVATQFLVNLAIIASFPLKMYGFLVLSTFWAGSLHPLAGHFIAEHYTSSKDAETFSYYGILNYVSYNVGYHNEHHDFPTIPWSKLPQVRDIASEFYDPLPRCECWVYCIYNYITDDTMGPFSRVKRGASKCD